MKILRVALLIVVIGFVGLLCDSYLDLHEVSDGSRRIASVSGCMPHVELQSAAWWARELGRSEAWVLQNHRIKLWGAPNSEGKGRNVGEMLPGSRAPVIEERGRSFRVRSPLDGSEGWVGEVQVADIVMQDVETREACSGDASESRGGVVTVECEDGTTYVGNRPEQACRR